MAQPAPSLAHAPVDTTGLEAATAAARAFLEALGVDTTAPDLNETPARMARAFTDLLAAEPMEWTAFDFEHNDGGLVTVTGLPFACLCAHHMLPFFGTADVSYLPVDRIAGLSKLGRLVRSHAQGPQVQERLTTQIADSLVAQLPVRGVAVRVRAQHLCMSLRGLQAREACTTTTALRGACRDDPAVSREWAAALHLTV